MPKPTAKTDSIASLSSPEIASFRLRRHHLGDEIPADPVTICRDICGVQAQVMSAAYLQLWARNHTISRAEIETALWKSRTLVKTSLMRQTIHLVPADEFLLYISALRNSRVAGALRIMAKFGISPEEAGALTALIMNALSSGPLSRAAITAAVRPRVSKRVRAWMEKVWSIVRIPVAEGLICYGPGEGNQVKFIRVDHWLPKVRLPKLKPFSEIKAQSELFRKYLRAYGPATANDFAHWAGIPMKDSRQACEHLKDKNEDKNKNKNKDEVVQVAAEGTTCMMLRDDLRSLSGPPPDRGSVKLLPIFDPFLLAHAEKDHLVESRHYKRVYRNQGWISPVILLEGKIAGTWSYKFQGQKIIVDIVPFEKLLRPIHKQIEDEAASLAAFFNKEIKIQ